VKNMRSLDLQHITFFQEEEKQRVLLKIEERNKRQSAILTSFLKKAKVADGVYA